MPTLDGVKYAYTDAGIAAYIKALRKKVNIATQIMGEELKAWI